MVAGTADRLEPGVLLRQMAPGRHYVVLHTHPGSTSLSVLDVALLVAQPAVAMVIAVGTDGTWYIGSLDTQRQRPSLRTIYDGYDATCRTAEPAPSRAPPFP